MCVAQCYNAVCHNVKLRECRYALQLNLRRRDHVIDSMEPPEASARMCADVVAMRCSP